MGPSGSGKSTIIQLIERFYNPSHVHDGDVKGEILLDGKPIESYDLRSLRRCMGYVGQEPVLFNTSIAENLKFAKPDATEFEMEQALKRAKAWDFVENLPGGINANVGASGGQLSGG